MPSIRIVRHQKAVDLPPQSQIRPIIPDQINSVGRPVIAHHILRAPQPVPEQLKKSPLLRRCRSLHIFWKRLHRLFVRLEEQSILALEVLEDRPFGDTELRGNIFHPRRVVAALRKMPDRYLHDPCSFRFRSRARLRVPPQLRWFRQTTCNSFHARIPPCTIDPKSHKIQHSQMLFQWLF